MTVLPSTIRRTRSVMPDLHERRPLAHVRVADDHVQPAEAFRVGVRLVAGVDDGTGARGGRRDALPDVLGALRDAVLRSPWAMQDLPCAAPDLTCHEERDQDVGHARELPVARDEVVLVTAVGVPGRVGVVLEEVDLTRDALLVEPHLRSGEERLQDALPRLVVRDELLDVVALRGRVLGMGADVEIEASAVLQEHVGGPTPVHDAPEEVAGDLVRREPALAPERARDAVLVLEPEDPAFHDVSLRRGTVDGGTGAERVVPAGYVVGRPRSWPRR